MFAQRRGTREATAKTLSGERKIERVARGRRKSVGFDCSLLVTEDHAGAIYRITYHGKR